jgi:hypothetical protein
MSDKLEIPSLQDFLLWVDQNNLADINGNIVVPFYDILLFFCGFDRNKANICLQYEYFRDPSLQDDSHAATKALTRLEIMHVDDMGRVHWKD